MKRVAEIGDKGEALFLMPPKSPAWWAVDEEGVEIGSGGHTAPFDDILLNDHQTIFHDLDLQGVTVRVTVEVVGVDGRRKKA